MIDKILHYLHVVVTFIIIIICMLACKSNKGWNLEGSIEGGADTTVYIEASNYENWYLLDSVRTDSKGNFKYQAEEAVKEPEILRLRLGDKYIYFPVDSLETVKLTAKAAGFDRGYTLSGNNYASAIVSVDSLVSATVDRVGTAGALTDEALKDALCRIVNTDTTCLVSYYVVCKTVDGAPLFTASSRKDIAIVGNAANNYDRLRPHDVRAGYLADLHKAMRQAAGTTRGVQMAATVTGRPNVDIVRYDARGNAHDFNEVVDRGNGVTILNFTRYDGEASQANTLALNQVYDAQKANGLEIYQIAFDANEAEWKKSAVNMPWVAVWNSPNEGVDALVAYNVDPIHGAPVSFVFNRAGEVVARVTDPTQLAAAVAKAQ